MNTYMKILLFHILAKLLKFNEVKPFSGKKKSSDIRTERKASKNS